MRKIRIMCETCAPDPRYQLEAVWVVFESVAVCDKCRMRVIEWMRSREFLLSSPHPFTDEFLGVERDAVFLGLNSRISR